MKYDMSYNPYFVISYFCRSFQRNLETFKMLTRLRPPKGVLDAEGHGVVIFFLQYSIFGFDLSVWEL